MSRLGWWRLLRDRDPSWHGLRRAARAAVVVPVNFAIGSEVIGSSQAVPPTAATESFLDVVLPAVDSCGDPERAASEERVLRSGQYLGDVDRFRPELLPAAKQLRTARAGADTHVRES